MPLRCAGHSPSGARLCAARDTAPGKGSVAPMASCSHRWASWSLSPAQRRVPALRPLCVPSARWWGPHGGGPHARRPCSALAVRADPRYWQNSTNVGQSPRRGLVQSWPRRCRCLWPCLGRLGGSLAGTRGEGTSRSAVLPLVGRVRGGTWKSVPSHFAPGLPPLQVTFKGCFPVAFGFRPSSMNPHRLGVSPRPGGQAYLKRQRARGGRVAVAVCAPRSCSAGQAGLTSAPPGSPRRVRR